MDEQGEERHLRELVHDMRVPVASLAAAVELLDEGEITDAVRAGVSHLRALLRWAEAAYSPAEESDELAKVDLRALAGEAAILLEPITRAKSLSVEVVGSVLSCGNPLAVTRVLVNLLGNAVRYAPQGSIITVTLKAGEGGAECLIEDTGPGFEGGQGTADQGWGMGLPLSRRLAERMGGSLDRLESPVGAAIRLTLPLATDEV